MRVKRLDPPPVRHDPRFAALVLAAGAGRRFGGSKLTAPLRGGALLDGALGAALAAPAAQVVVTTGADPAVAAAARAFAARTGEDGRLRLQPVADWAEGLAASLRAGLRALGRDVDGAFVFLGDMPDVPADAAWRVAEAFGEGVDAVEPAGAGEPAHPVLIGRALWPAALALTGERGARGLLRAGGVRRAEIELQDEGLRLDVDTPEALRALEAARRA